MKTQRSGGLSKRLVGFCMLHLYTLLASLGRIWRSGLGALMTVSVIAIALALPSVFLLTIENLEGATRSGRSLGEITVFARDALSETARARLKLLRETNDGFRISEVDLKLRGPGDIMGTQQSGLMDFNIADIVRDTEILSAAREEALYINNHDPQLQHEQLKMVARQLSRILKRRPNWGRIS